VKCLAFVIAFLFCSVVHGGEVSATAKITAPAPVVYQSAYICEDGACRLRAIRPVAGVQRSVARTRSGVRLLRPWFGTRSVARARVR
jgi:hypothetical protein